MSDLIHRSKDSTTLCNAVSSHVTDDGSKVTCPDCIELMITRAFVRTHSKVRANAVKRIAKKSK